MVTTATPHPNGQNKRATTTNRVNGFPGENELNDLRFKLAHNLQSTLDLSTALELFFNNIQDLVPTQGLHYTYREVGVDLEFGAAQKHQASYSIRSASVDLGQICFSRNRRFAESELAAMEMLIGVLFFPLRNALLYREALESSLRDTLTGVGNRAAMDMSFSREIKLAHRYQQPLSLLVIDIDHFKKINDSRGHRNGDKCLQHIVKIIQSTLRETDQIFRFGGEEFVALLHNTTAHDARLIAERIRLAVAMTPIAFDENDLLITASIGVGQLDANDDADALFEKADSALYQAKNSGRNKVVVGAGRAPAPSPSEPQRAEHR